MTPYDSFRIFWFLVPLLGWFVYAGIARIAGKKPGPTPWGPLLIGGLVLGAVLWIFVK